MELLPKNLKTLDLGLAENTLGDNVQHIQYLQDCIKYLPVNL